MALPLSEADIFGDDSTDELAGMTVDDIQRRIRLVDSEIRVFKVPSLSLARPVNLLTLLMPACRIRVFLCCTGQLGPLGFL